MSQPLEINAGDLRQIVDVEQGTESRSPSGAIVVPPWTIFALGVRCKIETLSGREAMMAGEFMAQATHQLTMWYLPGITAKMRINYKTDAQRAAGQDGRLFDILLVNDIDELHRWMFLMCRESARSHGV